MRVEKAGGICYRRRMANAATPMLQQYWQIKAQHPDPNTILFFRLGDFYEMFFEDAQVAAPLLDITLTTRNKNDPHPIPLCGVPYHAAEGYIARLIAAGKKVAICEQVEDPKTAKGVVRREVVRLVTPGAVFEPTSLDARTQNHLVAVCETGGQFGLAVVDISTGDFRATQLASWRAVLDELERLEPREVVLPQGFAHVLAAPIAVTPREPAQFQAEALPSLPGRDAIAQRAPLALPAAGAIWAYLQYTKLSGPALAQLIPQLTHYQPTDYLVLDEVTKRNLELTHTLATHERRGSLLSLLDQTATAMGARCLKQWLCYPLRDRAAIQARHAAIAYFLEDVARQQRCTAALTQVADLERIASRIITGHAHARDLIALRDSLHALPGIQSALADGTGLLQTLAQTIDPCPELVTRISATLIDEPPLALKDGGLIRPGFDPALDQLRSLQQEGKQFLARLEAQERERTGISSLKVRYNKVFGYYLEITNTHRDKIPADYLRKQTVANAERFITPQLKAYEEQVVTAHERSVALEYEHFVHLRQAIVAAIGRIKGSARALAQIDTLSALAQVAQARRYCQPRLVDEPVVQIRGGRHPVVEQLLTEERFVPNDCQLGGETSLLIITGPNMAGKSTIMRQAGLITLLAHMGSYVPAEAATIGLTDRIFTRVGASDNLARGQSTFMVEMTEVATILREATNRSLVLIDELGRGTSTYDGIAIAWAVAEHLHDQIGCRTLFATHYHELATLAALKPGIGNACMAVKEWNDQIIFLRTLIPGAADRSYGIEVARLAGLPAAVTQRARGLLRELENDPREAAAMPKSAAASQQYQIDFSE